MPKPIRGYVKKNIAETPKLSESVSGILELYTNLRDFQSDISGKIDSKLDLVDESISELKSEMDNALSMFSEKVSFTESLVEEARTVIENTKTEAIELIREIKQGEPGKDADEEAIFSRLEKRLPKFDEKKFKKEILESVTNKKADLKIIQQNVDVDPVSVIEKIMELPEEKRKKLRLGTDNISGLDQTIRAMQSQLGRGYFHGGGISNISGLIQEGDNITITGSGTSTDPYVINSTGGGGSQDLASVLSYGNFVGPTPIVSGGGGNTIAQLDENDFLVKYSNLGTPISLIETDGNGNLVLNFYDRDTHALQEYLDSTNQGEIRLTRNTNGDIFNLRYLNSNNLNLYSMASFSVGGNHPTISLGIQSAVPDSSSTYWTLSDSSRQIVTGGVFAQLGATSYMPIGAPGLDNITINEGGVYVGPTGTTVFTMTIDGNNRQAINKFTNTGGSDVISVGDTITDGSNTGTVVVSESNYILMQLDPGSDFTGDTSFTNSTTGGTFDIVGGVTPIADTFSLEIINNGTPYVPTTYNNLIDSSGENQLGYNIVSDALTLTGHTIDDSWQATVIAQITRSSYIDLSVYEWGWGDVDAQTKYAIRQIFNSFGGYYRLYGQDSVSQSFDALDIDFNSRAIHIGDTQGGLNGTVISLSDVTKTISFTADTIGLSFGKAVFSKTITPPGTTGDQTINTQSGSVNFAAMATSLVVTNSLVAPDSIIIATVTTNDGNMTSVQAVADSGFFTLYGNAAPSGETRVDFFINP